MVVVVVEEVDGVLGVRGARGGGERAFREDGTRASGVRADERRRLKLFGEEQSTVSS